MKLNKHLCLFLCIFGVGEMSVKSACRWTLTHDSLQQCHNCVHIFLDVSGSTEQNLILQQDHIGSFPPTFTLKGQDMNWGNVWPQGTFFVFWCKQGFPFSCFWHLHSICFFSLQIKTQTLFYGIKTALFFSPLSHHPSLLLWIRQKAELSLTRWGMHSVSVPGQK